MNNKMIWNIVGKVIKIEGFLLFLPLVTSLIYSEMLSALAFLVTAVFSLGLGYVLTTLTKTNNTVIYTREGFIIVALTWLFISVIGCFPFVISGQIPNFIDALFETVSGFTTTGASILVDATTLGYGMNLWRCFTNWIGGMGIIVFVVAFISKTSDRSIHILRAEMPGPIVDKIVPRSKDTAKIPYLIYIALTLTLTIMLWAGGMPLYDSIVHSFATAGTGGFSIKATGIIEYSSYSQWVIATFMILFGVNFNVYFLMATKKIRSALKSSELKAYFFIILTAFVIILVNVFGTYQTIEETLRHSIFQVSSILTTTGFSSTDFNTWNSMAKSTLLILMLIGGSAGSTAGGLKISRVMLLLKKISVELRRILNPNRVTTIRFEGKKIDDATANGTTSYFSLYIILIIVICFILSIDGLNLETNFSATISCLNNIGPGFDMVGPLSNYSCYSPLSKIVLMFAMLLGRLEIYPLLLALSPTTWLKK